MAADRHPGMPVIDTRSKVRQGESGLIVQTTQLTLSPKTGSTLARKGA